MEESCQETRASSEEGLVSVLSRVRFLLERETAAFVLASGLDFIMTSLLLRYDNGDDQIWFDESNPLARYFLYSWGINGLIAFKIAAVAFVVTICQIIAHRRIDVARRLLQFAALAASLVVIYSGYLLFHHT